ncbi:MAG: hypothetical protein U0694_16055 [Anaerolineae bacterium]
MKRWLLLSIVLFTFGTASAHADVPQAVDLRLHTRDGWLVQGTPQVSCGPTTTPFSGCEGAEAANRPQPEFTYPLPDEGVLLTAQGINRDMPLYLTLSQESNVVAEVTVSAAGDAVHWQPNAPAGDYMLTVQVVPAVETDVYLLYQYHVRGLTADETHRFFPAPPPLLLITNHGWVEGLHGGYCFPPGENMGCVDVAARPTPEDYDPLPQGNLINLRLGALPYPESVSFTLSRREGGEDAATLEYDLTDEPLDFLWTPDVAAGDYIVMVWLRWDGNADAMYIFGVNLAEPISPPQFGLWTADNIVVGGAQGSSCWPDALGTLCRDVMFATPEVYHPLYDGHLLYVVLQSNNFPAHVYASLYTPAMESVLSSAEMRAPEPGVYTLGIEDVAAGDYVAIISGFWEEGDSSTVFGVHID